MLLGWGPRPGKGRSIRRVCHDRRRLASFFAERRRKTAGKNRSPRGEKWPWGAGGRPATGRSVGRLDAVEGDRGGGGEGDGAGGGKVEHLVPGVPGAIGGGEVGAGPEFVVEGGVEAVGVEGEGALRDGEGVDVEGGGNGEGRGTVGGVVGVISSAGLSTTNTPSSVSAAAAVTGFITDPRVLL